MGSVGHIKRLLLSIAVIVVAGVGAYWIKSAAIEKQRQLDAINTQIEREQDRIIVLEADWAYLTRPQRIQRLAQEILSFTPITPGRILYLNPKAVTADSHPADTPPTDLHQAIKAQSRGYE